jgi:luciferase family oxidoreductase group 1
VAEHHGTPMLACASPEALIAPIAAATSRLRVGSGGVMLPHYSPLKVAETYSMLSGIFPGRIDLGIGRAPGSDPLTAFALQRDRRQTAPDDFPDQLAELLAYLAGPVRGTGARAVQGTGARTGTGTDTRPPGLPDTRPPGLRPPGLPPQFARLAELPGRPERPDVWLLGSSPQSGIWAAEFGLPYAFADFINPSGADIVARYRSDSGAASRTPTPESRVIVCGWALCAETDGEAERLGASARMAFARLLQGQPIPVPPVDEAVAFLAANGPAADALVRRRRWIVGSPSTVRAGLEALAAEYGADEVMIVTITYDPDARRESYRLIAREFGAA